MRRQEKSTGWDRYAHDADIGVRGYGATLAEAFENAARSMCAAVTPLEDVALERSVSVRCPGADTEILLADWLNAVIYEMATRNMLFGDFKVQIDAAGLRAELRGEPVDVARHAPAVELKGATLTTLAVERLPDGRWSAQCVVDV